MKPFVLSGNHIWTDADGKLRLMADSFSVCDENGRCAGVFEELPEQYEGLAVRDLGNCLIVPGYSDLHTHAPQYRNIGLGMDLKLIEWLSEIAYPEEARFSDTDYARKIYGRFAEEIRAGFTTRAVIFASAHREGSSILAELMENTGLVSYVGKVDMNRFAPDNLREMDAREALIETEKWINEQLGRYEHTFPILTLRFLPSCTSDLLEGLAELRKKYDLPLQSHLDEQPEEVEWVKELFPESVSYAEG